VSDADIDTRLMRRKNQRSRLNDAGRAKRVDLSVARLLP